MLFVYLFFNLLIDIGMVQTKKWKLHFNSTLMCHIILFFSNKISCLLFKRLRPDSYISFLYFNSCLRWLLYFLQCLLPSSTYNKRPMGHNAHLSNLGPYRNIFPKIKCAFHSHLPHPTLGDHDFHKLAFVLCQKAFI
jgi:hypothetical protein